MEYHLEYQSCSLHACSDDQLLNEDSGWGAYLEGRQRHGARGAAIPRPADPTDLPSSYAESMTSPTQPSPQVCTGLSQMPSTGPDCFCHFGML